MKALIRRLRRNSKHNSKNLRIMIVCLVLGVLIGFWASSRLISLVTSEDLSNLEVIKTSLLITLLLTAEYILASVFFISLVASIKKGFGNLKDYSQKGLLWHLSRGFLWAWAIGSGKGILVGFFFDSIKRLLFSEQFLKFLGLLPFFIQASIGSVIESFGLSEQSSPAMFATSLFGLVIIALASWFMLEFAIGLRSESKPRKKEKSGK